MTAETHGAPAGASPLLLTFALAIIAASLIAQAWLAFVQQFNGDELYFLGLIHDHQRGVLGKAVQTFHVHLLAPLTALGSDEIDQLIAGRLGMLVLELVSLASLYLLARAWAGTAAALVAVVAFAAMPLTIEHAASFRADPLALALTMASLALLARAPLRPWSIVAIAVLAALSALITIKTALFGPAFAGLAVWRVATSQDRSRTIWSIAAIAVVTIAVAAALFLLHKTSVAVEGPGNVALGRIGSTALFAGFLPNPGVVLYAAVSAPLQTLLLLAAIAAIAIRLAAGGQVERGRGIALLGLMLPLASLLFYRNSFPYFVPYISAPAFAAVAWFLDQRRWNAAMLPLLAAGMLVVGALAVSRLPVKTMDSQRAVVAAVHEIFPQPVHYIDRSRMIASFPGEGFLMTTWGMQEYQRRAPVFAAKLQSRIIPLLVVNGPVLEEAVGLREPMPPAYALHPADRALLRENYIPHWGPIWVAGKRLRPDGGLVHQILVPGTYTVEGDGLAVGGRELGAGDTVRLPRGPLKLSSLPRREVVLRWGDHLQRPQGPVPAEPPYTGF